MMFYRMMRRNASQLNGDRNAVLDLARGRLVLLSSFFAILYIILAVRAFDLSMIQGHIVSPIDHERGLSVAETTETPRGKIYDANGRIIATSLQMASLYADPALISNPKKAAKGLSKIFPDLRYGKTLQTLQSKKHFAWIKRNILPKEQAAIMELGEPGLNFRYEEKRVYPHKDSFSHLVGYTDIDGYGLSGIERSFDKMLGQGDDIHLTLDARLQHALHREVQRSMDEFTAKAGTGVIMNVNTGEILAGVSLPDFNPHEAGGAKKNNRFNRLTMGVYELGSVFKIFSTAAFLENNNVPMSTKFDAREDIKVGRHTISDYHAEDRILTIPEVFMYSSNIGSAMMGQAVGNDGLQKFYADLGLLAPIDFEISESARPLTPEVWRDVNTLTASYGHGIAVTPIHIAAAMSAVTNGGYWVQPTLIKSDIKDEGKRTRVLSEKTSRQMRELMSLVVQEGTGRNAKVAGYKVGGKTGTAEKSVAGGYDHTKLISSFAGVFPSDKPEYAIFIAIDEPVGNKKSFGYATAGWVAAPAVARVVKSMTSILGIAPDYSDEGRRHPLGQYIAVKG